jgi:transcriptional regulator with XRE-family HTH domain
VDFATFLKRLGQNVRRARWRAGLTQQDVAAKGITYRYYQELERGQRNPSLRMLVELSDILNVRVADLLDVGETRAAVKLAEVTAAPPARGRKRKRPRKLPAG